VISIDRVRVGDPGASWNGTTKKQPCDFAESSI